MPSAAADSRRQAQPHGPASTAALLFWRAIAGCLHDLQRFFRYDDPEERPSFFAVSKYNFARSDLVPLIITYPDDYDVVYNAREQHAVTLIPQQRLLLAMRHVSAGSVANALRRERDVQKRARMRCSCTKPALSCLARPALPAVTHRACSQGRHVPHNAQQQPAGHLQPGQAGGAHAGRAG